MIIRFYFWVIEFENGFWSGRMPNIIKIPLFLSFAISFKAHSSLESLWLRGLWVCGGVCEHNIPIDRIKWQKNPLNKEIDIFSWSFWIARSHLFVIFILCLSPVFELVLLLIFEFQFHSMAPISHQIKQTTYFKFYCFMKLSSGTNVKCKQFNK